MKKLKVRNLYDKEFFGADKVLVHLKTFLYDQICNPGCVFSIDSDKKVTAKFEATIEAPCLEGLRYKASITLEHPLTKQQITHSVYIKRIHEVIVALQLSEFWRFVDRLTFEYNYAQNDDTLYLKIFNQNTANHAIKDITSNIAGIMQEYDAIEYHIYNSHHIYFRDLYELEDKK